MACTGRARLQLEVEEDNTIHRNRQRMLNVYATRYKNNLYDFRIILMSVCVLESSEHGDIT